MARLPASHGGRVQPKINEDTTFSLTCAGCGEPIQAWGPKDGEMVWRHTVPLGSPSTGVSKWIRQEGQGYVLAKDPLTGQSKIA